MNVNNNTVITSAPTPRASIVDKYDDHAQLGCATMAIASCANNYYEGSLTGRIGCAALATAASAAIFVPCGVLAAPILGVVAKPLVCGGVAGCGLGTGMYA